MWLENLILVHNCSNQFYFYVPFKFITIILNNKMVIKNQTGLKTFKPVGPTLHFIASVGKFEKLQLTMSADLFLLSILLYKKKSRGLKLSLCNLIHLDVYLFYACYLDLLCRQTK